MTRNHRCYNSASHRLFTVAAMVNTKGIVTLKLKDLRDFV